MNAPPVTETAQPAPRVVLLEDHSIMRESLVSTLERAGVPVVGEFSDGRAFLDALGRLAPDVALVDLVLERPGPMAGMDGLSVLKAMRAVCPQVRAVVLSGMHTRAIVEEVYRAGAAAFLHKLDASQAQLIATVHAVARGQHLAEAGEMGQGSAVAPGPPSGSHEELRSRLTLRERQVLGHMATGADNLKIAALLDITERTVRAHVSSLYRKLGCENRAELALLARDMGLYASGG